MVSVLDSYRKKLLKRGLSIYFSSSKSHSLYFCYTFLHALQPQSDKIILCSCQCGFPPYKTFSHVTPRPELFKPYYETEIAQMNKVMIFKSSLI